MALNIEDAKRIADKLIKESGRDLEVKNFSEIHSDDANYNLYVFSVADKVTGEEYYFGELFPAIRKKDGALVDFSIPPPGFE